jgi:RNA polymerase sigma factor FliA
MSDKQPLEDVNPMDLRLDVLNQLNQSGEHLTSKEQQLVEEYHYVIESVAGRIASRQKLPPTLDYNDLISIGFDGLIKAIRQYDKASDAQLKTYANIRIRGEMLDHIRKEWKTKSPVKFNSMQEKIKQRVSEVVDGVLQSGDKKDKGTNLLSTVTTAYMVSLDNVMEVYGDNVRDSSQHVEQSFELTDEFDGLNRLLMEFSKEDQGFIDLFYRKEYSQKQIAKDLDISEASVCRLHQRILTDLKCAMEN